MGKQRGRYRKYIIDEKVPIPKQTRFNQSKKLVPSTNVITNIFPQNNISFDQFSITIEPEINISNNPCVTNKPDEVIEDLDLNEESEQF
jgi:hypothetical protein